MGPRQPPSSDPQRHDVERETSLAGEGRTTEGETASTVIPADESGEAKDLLR